MPPGSRLRLSDFDDLDPSTRRGIAALIAEMERGGIHRGGPVRSVMALLGDRWSPLILLVLATGRWRHAELRRVTAHLSAEKALSQKVMTFKLRALERDGFVLREASEDIPPKVTYALSPLGLQLVDELRRMTGWLNARRREIEAARERFDDG